MEEQPTLPRAFKFASPASFTVLHVDEEPFAALRELDSFRAYDRTSVERFAAAARAAGDDVERALAGARDRAAAAETRLAGAAGLERLLAATLVEAHRALSREERENRAAIDVLLYAAGRESERLVESARAEAAALRAASGGAQRSAPAGPAPAGPAPPPGRATTPCRPAR